MKRILITGANSYIGVCLERYLFQFPERYQVQTMSVRTEEWKQGSFRGFDAIFHVAGIVHQGKTKDDPAQMQLYHRVNTLLPFDIASKAKREGVGQFLFMSSESVYGCRDAVGQVVQITRDTPLEPKDNYGRSKLAAERLLQPLSDEQFRVAMVRAPMIYGKGCKGNYVALSRLARKTPVFPKVDNRRSMLYIENLCEFLRLLIEDEAAGIFCPQNEEYTDVGLLVREIARVHGKRLVLIPGCLWALKLLSHRVKAVNKAFGSLVYAPELSQYPKAYCVKSLRQSIEETERE